MAPAACDTIHRNLEDFSRSPEDYDAIITGDLGMVGQHILFDLLAEKGTDISSVHQDCGLLIYDNRHRILIPAEVDVDVRHPFSTPGFCHVLPAEN